MVDESFSSVMDSSVYEVDTANPIGTDSNQNLTYRPNFEIIHPASFKNYTITSTAFEKIKTLCQKKHKWWSWLSEVSLALSTLFWGAFFSALISKIPLELSVLSVLFYCVSPFLGGVLLLAFFLVRDKSIQSENSCLKKLKST